MQAPELLFQTIFDQLTEPRIVLLPNAPVFTVAAANKAYIYATGNNADTLQGQSLWDVFRADTASANARSVFENGLNDAIRHRAGVKLPIFRFDIVAAVADSPKPRWWQVEISPVTNANDEVIYLVCTTRNVTLHVEDQAEILKNQHENAALLIRQQEQTGEAEQSERRNKALSDSEYKLNRIFSSTPIGLSIIKRNNLIVEAANNPILKLWGRSHNAVMGQPLLQVFPELHDQPFITHLTQVFDTGNTVKFDRQPAVIVDADGKAHNVFMDFSYDPLFDTNDEVDAVLITVNNVTDIVNANKLLQEREEELEVMNEELKATNEELYASNEELTAMNEELTKLREQR